MRSLSLLLLLLCPVNQVTALSSPGADGSVTTIRGRVINEKTKEPVPYVNIGLKDRNVGTLSDVDGSFVLSIPGEFQSDPVYFSSIGYEVFQLFPGSSIQPSGGYVISMKPKTVMLQEVEVRGKKRLHIDRLGWMGGKDGVLPLDTIQGGGAVALLLMLPKAPALVEKLQVRLMYNSKDTATLRLHFYAFDSLRQAPGRELLTREILLKEAKRFGWLRFDLKKYNIELNEKKFFVGFEWIDDRETRTAMVHGLKAWEKWKREQYDSGNAKVERIMKPGEGTQYKYHGNMMNWPGFNQLPPFTGLMVETGKHEKTTRLKTMERKTSFGSWRELESTLNAVVTVAY